MEDDPINKAGEGRFEFVLVRRVERGSQNVIEVGRDKDGVAYRIAFAGIDVEEWEQARLRREIVLLR